MTKSLYFDTLPMSTHISFDINFNFLIKNLDQ